MSGFSSNKEAVMAALDEALINGMNDSLLRFAKMLRTKLSIPGTGRIYRIGKGRRKGRNLREKGFHRASAPGRPPAVNTNRLRASWATGSMTGFGTSITGAGNRATIRADGKAIVLEFGSRVPYAPMLEYGTRTMKARPYLKPTMRAFQPFVGRIFANAVKRRFSSP